MKEIVSKSIQAIFTGYGNNDNTHSKNLSPLRIKNPLFKTTMPKHIND